MKLRYIFIPLMFILLVLSIVSYVEGAIPSNPAHFWDMNNQTLDNFTEQEKKRFVRGHFDCGYVALEHWAHGGFV